MPSTLKKTSRRPFSLTRSLFKFMKSEICKSDDSDPRGVSASKSQEEDNEGCPPKCLRNETISRPYPMRHSNRRARNRHQIYTLPNEIIAHIFILGSQDNIMFPVTVSHVCSAWRNLALRTPSLWRSISLDRRTDMWRERIRRAKACSLDVQLSSHSRKGSGWVTRHRVLDFHSVQWYMHVANPWIRRWRSLEITFHDYAPFLWNAALSTCCSNDRRVAAPLLEELVLIYPNNDDSKEFALFGGDAPRLRRVTLVGIRLEWWPSLFGNLTVLDYTHHGFTTGHDAVSEILYMLEVSSRVQELRMTLPSRAKHVLPASSDNLIHDPVTLPSLRKLHLRVQGDDIPLELIIVSAHLRTPELLSLHLADGRHSRYSFPRLHTFLRAFLTPDSLVSLRVECGWYDFRLLTRWAGKLPNLRHFLVQDALGKNTSLFEAMHTRSANRRGLPSG